MVASRLRTRPRNIRNSVKHRRMVHVQGRVVVKTAHVKKEGFTVGVTRPSGNLWSRAGEYRQSHEFTHHLSSDTGVLLKLRQTSLIRLRLQG